MERRLPGEQRQTDAGERLPEGEPSPDQVGREGAMGVPAQGADTAGAPPAVEDHPSTGDVAGRPDPAGAGGPVRTDLPPHAERPAAAAGWDAAVDLEAAPATIPDLAETP